MPDEQELEPSEPSEPSGSLDRTQLARMQRRLSEESPTSNNRYYISRGIRQNFYEDSVEFTSDTSPSETISPESPLMQARQRLEIERNERQSNIDVPNEERERGYFFLVDEEKQRRMTVEEIVESEMPINVDQIPHRLMQKIQEVGHPNVFSNRGNSFYRCHKCNVDTKSAFAYFCLGNVYCAEHVPEVHACAVCLSSTKDAKAVVTYDERTIMVCERCIKRAQRCNECSQPLAPGDVETPVCAKCRAMHLAERPYRSVTKTAHYVNGTHPGGIMKSARIFSAEIECGFISKPEAYSAAKGIPAAMGVSEDGSLRIPNGIEFQTPRLRGDKGETLLEEVGEVLKAGRATINDSCGMHIHLDAAGIMPGSRRGYPQALIQLWGAHLEFEDVILSLVPFKRRLNKYSRPMRPFFNPFQIRGITSMQQAERLWYRQIDNAGLQESKSHHYHTSRYFGVNFHPLFSHGHLEIRYHSGTLNMSKILEWANLHALIMDAAADGKFTKEFMDEASSTLDLKEKTALLFDLIGLSGESKGYFFKRQIKFGKKSEDEGENERGEGVAIAVSTGQPPSILQVVDEFF